MADNPTCPNCGHYNAVLSGICRDCGHIVNEEELASGPVRVSEIPDDAVDASPETDPDLALDPLSYRGRGRPRLEPDQKRREKLMVSLTETEMKALVLISAELGYRKVQDFVRAVINRTVQHFEKKKGQKP